MGSILDVVPHWVRSNNPKSFGMLGAAEVLRHSKEHDVGKVKTIVLISQKAVKKYVLI